MQNITITLDEATAGRARLQAAGRPRSVSRLTGELLQSQMQRAPDRGAAGRRAVR